VQERSPSAYQQLADLEDKINRANEYIQRLKQDNSKLQQKVSLFEQEKKSPARMKVGDLPQLRREKVSPRRRRSSSRERDLEKPTSARRRRSRKGWSRVYPLRLAMLVVAALTVLWIIISVISSVVQLISRSIATPNQPNTELLNQLPTTPLLPPEIPPGTRAIALPKATATNVSLKETDLVYNVTNPPDLKPSQQLQEIVDEMVQTIQARRISPQELSIALINVKTGETAGYQQQLLKYPASVVKMFWMVNVFDQMQQGILPNEPVYGADLNRMIQQSSNDAASRLFDSVTNTESGYNLRGEKYDDWVKNRRKVSEFFNKAGYEGIALHQKTYPISYLRHKEPEGRDMQMWNDPRELRNQISSEHAARLMYEIVTGKAVSPEASAKMMQFLARDLRLSGWRENTARFGGFNPVRGFLGQGLSSDVDFASKAGWTESGRHEVAYVRSRDEDGPIYILAILGADEGYSKDWELFPQLSQLVFDRMRGRTAD
jgi:beta-lactamase class A/cell division protein FtsL